MVRRQWFNVENIDGGAGNSAFTQSLDERRLLDDRSTRGVHEPGRRLHGGELGCSNQASRPTTEHEVDRYDVRQPEQLVLGSQPHTLRFCLFRREVLAPRDHLHAEGEPNSRYLRPDVAEAEDTQNLASKTVTDHALPTARTQRGVFGGNVTGARQDQSPGQFDGGTRVVAGMHHGYVVLGGCRHVDRGIAEG